MYAHKEYSSLADCPSANGLTVNYLVFNSNATLIPREPVTKSDHFQSIHRLGRLAHSLLVLGLAIDLISSPCVVKLTPEDFGSRSCSSGPSRASPQYDLLYRS